MSKDDRVCKPLLAEYNRNIALDLGPAAKPFPYPWPAPPHLRVDWQPKRWQALAKDELVMKDAYAVVSADLDGDGHTELVVRTAAWLRGDDRFTSLDVFKQDALIPSDMRRYEQVRSVQSIARIVPGVYSLPMLKEHVEPTELNDFDVIHFAGKWYVTGKTADIEATVELHDAPNWRVISHLRYGKPSNQPRNELDWILDSVCYLRMTTGK